MRQENQRSAYSLCRFGLPNPRGCVIPPQLRRAPDTTVHDDAEHILHSSSRAEEVIAEGGSIGVVIYQDLEAIGFGHYIPELEPAPPQEAWRTEEHPLQQEDRSRDDI